MVLHPAIIVAARVRRPPCAGRRSRAAIAEASREAAESTFRRKRSTSCSPRSRSIPIALLAQMLLCASNPGKGGWRSKNGLPATSKGTELQDAATKSGFEPSFVALVLFPAGRGYDGRPDRWTTQLGQAFAADRRAVFASIQRLRAKAQRPGTLKSTPQQDVETDDVERRAGDRDRAGQSAGRLRSAIQPAGRLHAADHVHGGRPGGRQRGDRRGGLIGFTAGIAIGAAIDNDYYYGPYGWHGGGYMHNDAWDDYYDHARRRARGLAGPSRGPGRGARAARGPRTARRARGNAAGTAHRAAADPAGEPPRVAGAARAAAHRGAGRGAGRSRTRESRGRERAKAAPRTRPGQRRPERSGTGSDAFSATRAEDPSARPARADRAAGSGSRGGGR